MEAERFCWRAAKWESCKTKGKGEGGKEDGVVVERGAKSDKLRLEAGAEKAFCPLTVIGRCPHRFVTLLIGLVC
jgi:hypothetical protein